MKGETDATIYRRSALRTAESKDRTHMPEENALQPDLSFDELRFLTTLWETRSLTTAAARHRISMGSASRRLAHLREVFNDELFVRSGLIMLPTGRIRALYPRVESVLRTSLSLFSQDAFDLANTRRIVRILSVDNGVMTLMNEAIGRFYQSAPNASIAIRSIDDRLFERLREGEADMALFPIQNVPKDFHVLELYKTRRGLLVREGHPLIERYNKKGCITLEDLSEFRKIDITFSGAPPWHQTSAAVAEEACQEAAFSMPFFLAVPYVRELTVFTYMAPVITLMYFVMQSAYKLRMLPAPPEVAPFTPCIIWHHGSHTDPFLQWERAVIADGCRNEARRLGAIVE